MKTKSFLNFLHTLSDFQLNMLFTSEDDEICKTNSMSSSRRSPRNFDDFQIFADHLKLNERFKKTLYYGKLPATECPSLPLSEATLELFTKTVPNGGLDVLDMHYAASVSRKACISPCSMIIAIMYLDQLRHKNPEYLQNVASCDLFLISMLVASKFLYDNGEEEEVFNAEWACSASVDVKDLNNIERKFLAALNWEAFVRPTDFFSLVRDVECRIALKEMSKRGWFTYTDISVLLHNSVSVGIITILVDNVIKVIVIIAAAYVAGVLTLFGASRMCQWCIPVVQDAYQVATADNASDLTVTNNAFNPEVMTSVAPVLEDTSYESLNGDWLGSTLLYSDVPNETLSLNGYSHPGAYQQIEQSTYFLQGGCKDFQEINQSTFTNRSLNGHFTASDNISCFTVYIETCFDSTIHLQPTCFCTSKLDLWLSSIYKTDYSFSVYQKYFSNTLKE